MRIEGEPSRLAPADRTDTKRAHSFRVESEPAIRIEPTNVGLGLQIGGEVLLSSFIVASRHINVECTPMARFYVQFGEVAPGVIVDVDRARQGAAVCDFTAGGATAGVRLRSDGVLVGHILDRP